MNDKKRPLLFDALNIDTLDKNQQIMINAIDAMLPQTQCGLCGYRDGCLPYAHAIITKNEQTNLCVPGGDETSANISRYLNRPIKKAMPSKWPIHPATARPTKMLAIINASDCIGCTKCILACPVDAIIGTGKHIHSIIPDLCTGCELCIAPCPVDCIELTAHPNQTLSSHNYRQQYHHHLWRMTKDIEHKPIVSHTQAILGNLNIQENPTIPNKDYTDKMVKLAKLRTQIKKLEKQLNICFNEQKSLELNKLKQELIDAENTL